MDPQPRPRRFLLVLVKPSHYDDDGYVIQWLRSPLPANSLACLYGLGQQIQADRALGADVELELLALDETNARVDPARLARDISAAGAGMVMLVGVQSNQFPRALDLARRLRSLGVTVGIGGFHVSGTLAMLPAIEPAVQAAMDLGCILFAGEAEQGRLTQVLADVIAGAARPIYDFMSDLPALEGAPIPHLPTAILRRTLGAGSSFDAGRGCPFQCSFCTIINVQGRKSRRRSADDIEAIIRANHAQGVISYFITDDNFARNKDWEAIFDRLIWLRETQELQIHLVIQVDTLCHRLPGFIEKAARAGVRRVFIGLENVSPDNLLAAKKRQNKITEYRTMLLAWKAVRVVTYCGYILGFPADTPERILRDVETVKRELPVDILEFFFLTPLPGSEDHKRLLEKGVPMESDLNNYDLDHVCAPHGQMSPGEWRGAYLGAWQAFYTPAHVITVMKRALATGNSPGKVLFLSGWFKGAIDIEGVHPLECGLLRRKVRADRRPSLPQESPLLFYPRYALETLVKLARWGALYLRFAPAYYGLKLRRRNFAYSDAALTPVSDTDEDDLTLFQSDEAKAYVVQQRHFADIRAAAATHVA